ncbi:trmt5, partial [Symbiodinium pilosum]
DLNPASIHWLRKSVQLNKLPNVQELEEFPDFGEDFTAPSMGSLLVIHAPGDARKFIPGLFQKRHPVTHAVFNLPAAGVELLDCFRGLDYVAAELPAPLVCCYTFSDASVDSAGSDGCVADLLVRLAASLSVPV